MRFLRFISVLLMVSLLASCAGQTAYKPIPFKLGRPAEDSPEKYKLGWNDGCETGLSTMVMGYYKTFYKFKQDVNLYNDPMYYKAWKDSYTYCRQYAFRYTWDAFDRTPATEGKTVCVFCSD